MTTRTFLSCVFMFLMVCALIVSVGSLLFCHKIDKEQAEYQQRMEAMKIEEAQREAAKEAEYQRILQELEEEWYNKKMEEARAKAEEIMLSSSIIEEVYETILPNTEAVETTTVEETVETDAVFEAVETTTVEETVETEAVFEVVVTTAAEETVETEAGSETDTATESIEATKEIKTNEYNQFENYTTNEISQSLQHFLEYNYMSLEDFIIGMTCIVYPEACGESFVGKQGVAEVAMNWINSGLKTEWWDVSSGFANMPVQRYYELVYSYSETDRIVIAECRQAVENVIAGAHPVEDLLGVKPYYFLLPEKSDPINVFVMMQATYQVWVGNQLYLGIEGVDWSVKN